MRLRWFPWKYIIRRTARAHGFLDPIALLSQFNQFAQPSEVAVPIELLRAGIVFHARGLLNARTIQSNLDWVWPYWVQQQFNPRGRSFVPRSFSVTHVNITHRNWTAVGFPDCPLYPIVDPRGLVTFFWDGWSVDAAIADANGDILLPPRAEHAAQRIVPGEDLAVETMLTKNGIRLQATVDVPPAEKPVCRVRYRASSQGGGFLALALRPFNPEGISPIRRIRLESGGTRWAVNGVACIEVDPSAGGHLVSSYREGDVLSRLPHGSTGRETVCEAGMATAAATYELPPGEEREVTLRVSLSKDPEAKGIFPAGRRGVSWSDALRRTCRLQVPDHRFQSLYDGALRALILHCPGEAYPGPFYYKRFWFRDAVFMVHALLGAGLHSRAERVIDRFAPRQTVTGHFESQKGEWDSNGQVLWIMRRFCELTGEACKSEWFEAILKGANWIRRKRLAARSNDLHAGLLPAGFSAEHLGNNDYYYWDNFWAAAGLASASLLSDQRGDHEHGVLFRTESEHLLLCIERSLLRSRHIRRSGAVPASPHRRMDAGAVGSLVAGYPLRLWPPNEPRLLETLEFLLERCFIDRAFFQDMIHSGLNTYLSLHCAQCLLRAGDERYLPVVERAAELASSTGQWPEAIHPLTLGGCMGDGQHVWAAAEWIMMLFSMFVREEEDDLILLSGIPPAWLNSGPVEMGPIHTRFGPVTVGALETGGDIRVSWRSSWRVIPDRLLIRMPARQPAVIHKPKESGEFIIRPEG